MESTINDALERNTKLMVLYAEFFGHCLGLLDVRDENYITDFDVVVRLHELAATYEVLIKDQAQNAT